MHRKWRDRPDQEPVREVVEVALLALRGQKAGGAMQEMTMRIVEKRLRSTCRRNPKCSWDRAAMAKNERFNSILNRYDDNISSSMRVNGNQRRSAFRFFHGVSCPV